MNLLTPDEIKKAATLASRQAGERAELAGRQENERREMAERHRIEAQSELGAPPPPPKARKVGPRG